MARRMHGFSYIPPRYCGLKWCTLRSVLLEEGFSAEAAKGLEKRGHAVRANIGGHARAVFGRGQIIRRNPKTGVLWGGSEPRADGQVIGW